MSRSAQKGPVWKKQVAQKNFPEGLLVVTSYYWINRADARCEFPAPDMVL